MSFEKFHCMLVEGKEGRRPFFVTKHQPKMKWQNMKIRIDFFITKFRTVFLPRTRLRVVHKLRHGFRGKGQGFCDFGVKVLVFKKVS